jgi:hypothetical protein
MRPLLAASVAAVVALLAVPVAGSAARPSPAALIQKGLTAAVERGALSPTEAAGYRATLANVLARSKRLPPLRTELLEAVVRDVAAQWRSYTAPRALTLFSTLTVNAEWLGSHALTGPHPDIEGDDGAVYRFFAGHGYVFHPLANFAKLNAEVAAKDDAATAHLASPRPSPRRPSPAPARCSPTRTCSTRPTPPTPRFRGCSPPRRRRSPGSRSTASTACRC